MAHKNNRPKMAHNKMAAVRHFFNGHYKSISDREVNAFSRFSLVSPVGCHKGKPKGVVLTLCTL
jgi:hypothetical protein